MEKILTFDNLNCIYGGTAKASNGVLRFEYEGKEDWPEVEIYFPDGLKGYNSVSFDILVHGGAFVLPFILTDSKGRRMVSSISERIGRRFIPNGEWLHITWDFRNEAKYSIDPPSFEPFDYDSVTKISFCVYTVVAPNFYALIKNVRFSSKTSGVSAQKNWESFRDGYTFGDLKNKKALLWAFALSKSKDRSGVINIIDCFEHFENLTAFDGLIMEIAGYPYEYPHRGTFFTPADLDEGILQRAVDAYKAHDWKHFKHNFIRLDIAGISKFKNPDGSKMQLDWFDEDLFQKKIYPKIVRFARALKEMGCHLVLDNEGYQDNPFDKCRMYAKHEKSFEEFEAMLKKRGREFVEIFERECPNITILLTHGNWKLAFPPQEDRYGLLPAFLDGMCEGANTVKLVDGFENGYDFASEESIIKGVYDCTHTAKSYSKIPALYEQKMQSGYALWLRTNCYTNEQFSTLLERTLQASDEYVWVYTENSNIERQDVQEHLLFANERLLKSRE